MAVESQHPDYTAFRPLWDQLRDTYKGQQRIKEEGTQYLPFTAGQVADGVKNSGDTGLANYAAYKKRARFPAFVTDAVDAALGVIHRKPAAIELPTAMEPMLERATIRGESMQQLLRRITEQQLITGRCGVFADIENDSPAGTTPHLALYWAEDIINWDDGQRQQVRQQTNLIVLDESEQVRIDQFEWERREKYRVLRLNPESGLYEMGLFIEGENGFTFNEADMALPAINGATFDEIPFVVINPADIVLQPDDPPLLDLSNLSLTIYRGEADYRQGLHMQGQDTLVIRGGLMGQKDGTVQAGAGAVIQVDVGGDAKYIGVDSKGLAEQREALMNDRHEADSKGGKLLNQTGKEAESGEALHIRVSARTASLTQISQTGAAGLQECLRKLAKWMGLDPEQVTVEPNLDFSDQGLTGKEILDMQTAKMAGAPISQRTIHDHMRERDVTAFTYEEELEEIANEAPLVGNPEDDEPDEDDDPRNQE